MENFPWTRLAGVELPTLAKPMIDLARYQRIDPGAKKALIGDGNFGGHYQRPDADMAAVWETAVLETRGLIAADWD
jgi:creatinine amidohydrolase